MLNLYLGHNGFSVAEHLRDIPEPNQGIQIIVNLANKTKQKIVSGTFGDVFIMKQSFLHAKPFHQFYCKFLHFIAHETEAYRER